MGPAALGLIQGGLETASSLYTNAQNARAVKEANEAQMNFQKYMSDTAHQREVADLKAAGLNPMLSGMGGSGAPTATGSANAPVFENSLGKGLASARESAAMKKDMEAKDSDIELKQAAAITEAGKYEQAVTSAKAEEAREKNLSLQNKQMEATLAAIRQQGKNDEQRAKEEAKFIKSDAIMKRVQQGVSTASDAAGILMPKVKVGKDFDESFINPGTGEIYKERQIRYKK